MRFLDRITLCLALTALVACAPRTFDNASGLRELAELAKIIELYLNEYGEPPLTSGIFDPVLLKGANDRGIDFSTEVTDRHIYSMNDGAVFRDKWGNPVDVTFSRDAIVVRSKGPNGIREINGDDVEFAMMIKPRQM
ncbi:MAG TPA: hypothetical protein VMN36_08205 [Verrucomicrobiales bacterium]|nr:hypothetical protein [Verrucomicrobiales bacterium]